MEGRFITNPFISDQEEPGTTPENGPFSIGKTSATSSPKRRLVDPKNGFCWRRRILVGSNFFSDLPFLDGPDFFGGIFFCNYCVEQERSCCREESCVRTDRRSGGIDESTVRFVGLEKVRPKADQGLSISEVRTPHPLTCASSQTGLIRRRPPRWAAVFPAAGLC